MVEFDPDKLKRRLRRADIDIARLARQHPVKAQSRDQAARRGFAGQGLFPVQSADANDQPLFSLSPDDIPNLQPGVLDMG